MFYTGAGTAASDAIYYTATYGQGIQPCALSVSGLGGGFITVADSNQMVLYLQPTDFGVLIDTGYDATNSSSPRYAKEQNALYTVATQAVSQAPDSLSQFAVGGRTLLPTIRAVLSSGSSSTLPFNYSANDAELYSGAAGTWTETGSFRNGGVSGPLVTLYSGNALQIGGYGSDGTGCQIYSPSSNTWRETGPLAAAGGLAGVALLNNGKVLIAGGNNDPSGPGAEAELYDELAGTWSSEATCLSICAFLGFSQGLLRVDACHGRPQ